MARAALAVHDYLAYRNKRARELGGPIFEARIGVHAGPIIGGIVGRDRVRYGVFDDARLNLIDHGSIEAKGKGTLRVWSLLDSARRVDESGMGR